MADRKDYTEPSYYDISYSMPAVSLTGGAVAISTKPGVYYGLRILATTADCTVIVYDNSATASGTIVDVVLADSSVSLMGIGTLLSPVIVKSGLYATVSEAGAKGVVFFCPKG